ncbi:MAG: lysophospholipid acyltransferase family protein [Verrucomicrobiales bacterium]|nr:lysophospholipid acyltransferase family protein [Verrucomicrobiales bacterium]
MANGTITDAIPNRPEVPATPGPSVFYGARLWRLGLATARTLPPGLMRAAVGAMARTYLLARPRRREIVVRNLLPLCNGDRAATASAADRLFVNFGRKLADLMRFEAGLSLTRRFVALNDWERFREVEARRQGVLMLTPHLGNWEIGAPLLVERGVKLLIVTQAEPGEDLTELRRQSRDRWGVETLVIGRDAFAVVEIIKRLQDGACVAMLIDRPPPTSSVPVTLAGRPFAASVAPAELARASGCALVGVYIVEQGRGYSAHVLPEFRYDRAALGNRENRRQLAQAIITAFEPVIREHADQWYHFVPIWPEETNSEIPRHP